MNAPHIKSTATAAVMLRRAVWLALAAGATFFSQGIAPSATPILFAIVLVLGSASIVALVVALLRFARSRPGAGSLDLTVDPRAEARKLGFFLVVASYILAAMQFVSPHPPSNGKWSWLTSAVYEAFGNPGLALLWFGGGTFLLIAMRRR